MSDEEFRYRRKKKAKKFNPAHDKVAQKMNHRQKNQFRRKQSDF